jgi:branched-chain amino acid transport system permease protein
MKRHVRSFIDPLSLIVAVATVALPVGLIWPNLLVPVANALAMAVFVIGYYTFVGNSGVVSFGHAAFASIGAFVTAMLCMSASMKSVLLPGLPGWIRDADLPPLLAVCVGAAVATVFGAVVGVPLMRLSGIAASIATLSLLVIVRNVEKDARDFTGGGTLAGIPSGISLFAAVGLVAIAILASWIYQVGPNGLRLRATREDLPAAISVGISVERERWIAFVLSAFLTGVSGGMVTLVLGSVSADNFFLQFTFFGVAMLAVGGMKSLAGAVTGVAVLSIIGETLSWLEAGSGSVSIPAGSRLVVLAAFMLLMLWIRPTGLTRGRELSDLLRARGWPTTRTSSPIQ